MQLKFKPSSYIIKTLSDAFCLASEVQNFRGTNTIIGTGMYHEVYRGQENICWPLLPSLCRIIKNPIELQQLEKEMIYDLQCELEKSGLSNILQTGFLNGYYHRDWLMIQQAQHLGMPTKFMDWTNKLQVALFFAVFDPKNDIYDGVLWVYLVPTEKLLLDNEKSVYRKEDPFNYPEWGFLNSASLASEEYFNQLGVRRKDIQQGRFLIQPYIKALIPLEKNPNHFTNMTRIIIPKTAKAELRKELEKLGIIKERLLYQKNARVEEIVSEIRKKYGI
jgi:hypothetical protein